MKSTKFSGFVFSMYTQHEKFKDNKRNHSITQFFSL